MAERRKPTVPVVRIRRGDSLKTMYAKAHRALTAAELQEFTEVEPGVPAREVLAELEALDEKAKRRHQRKPRNGRSR